MVGIVASRIPVRRAWGVLRIAAYRTQRRRGATLCLLLFEISRPCVRPRSLSNQLGSCEWLELKIYGSNVERRMAGLMTTYRNGPGEIAAMDWMDIESRN